MTRQYGSTDIIRSMTKWNKLHTIGTGTLNEIDGQQGLKCTQSQNNADSVKLTWSNITQTHIEARVCTALGQQGSQMFEANTAEFDNVTVSLSNEIAGGSGNLSVSFTTRQKILSRGHSNTATPRFLFLIQ